MTDSQLARLAKPFPARLIHSNPSGGGSYVKHSVVTEKLLAVVGPFDFELVEVIRGTVAGKPGNPNGTSQRAKDGTPDLDQAVVGCVARLTAQIDGRRVAVDECGDCESPHNWPHDGARLKDAMSDALKRCAMRLGVTLHLWSQDEFSLYDQIKDKTPVAANPPAAIREDLSKRADLA
jgi:hypothetical protein